MINICVICNKEFEAIKSTKKYCSKECENAARRIKYKKAKENGLDPHKMGMQEKECLICRKKFTPKSASANKRSCCYDCMPEGKQLTRSDFLNLLRNKYGGKCQKCGYNNYLGALDFHHIDPTQKDFTIGNRDFKLEDCINEIKKCILLCSNCHKELHAGLWDISDIKNIREEEVESNAINT